MITFSSPVPLTIGSNAIGTVRVASANDSYAGPITLALHTGSGTLSGTLTQNAVNGIATFPNLSISEFGRGLSLIATAPDHEPAISEPFDMLGKRSMYLAANIFNSRPRVAFYRNAGALGIADSPRGVISYWIYKYSPSDGSNPTVFWWCKDLLTGEDGINYPSGGSVNPILVQSTRLGSASANRVPQMTATKGAPVDARYRFRETDIQLVPTTMYHVLCSYDVNFAPANRLRQIAINGTLAATYVIDLNDGVAFSVPLTTMPGIAIGAAGFTGTLPLPAGAVQDLAEIYINTDTYLDLSIPANIAKFRDPATGLPADLGANGENPTGAPPAIYLSMSDVGPAAGVLVNKGYGGDFAVYGAVRRGDHDPWTG